MTQKKQMQVIILKWKAIRRKAMLKWGDKKDYREK